MVVQIEALEVVSSDREAGVEITPIQGWMLDVYEASKELELDILDFGGLLQGDVFKVALGWMKDNDIEKFTLSLKTTAWMEYVGLAMTAGYVLEGFEEIRSSRWNSEVTDKAAVFVLKG